MDARKKWMSNKTRKKLRNWLYENTVMSSEKLRIDADEDNNSNLCQDLWKFKDVIRFAAEKLDEVLSEVKENPNPTSSEGISEVFSTAAEEQ
jgi:hypothetical protein